LTGSDKAAPYGIVEAKGRVSSRFSSGTAAIETAVDGALMTIATSNPEAKRV
jgi:hypothetical protein